MTVVVDGMHGQLLAHTSYSYRQTPFSSSLQERLIGNGLYHKSIHKKSDCPNMYVNIEMPEKLDNLFQTQI